MNHKTIEVKNRLGELPPVDHFPTQSLQHNCITKDSKRTPTGPGDSNEVQETKIANSLLAAILACYKSAVINTSTPSYPLNLQKGLASYMERQASEAVQSISTGSSDLERQAASIALTSTCIKDALPLIDVIFYIIINLKRPLSSFSESIKFNAKAAFNVVIASIADGIRSQDYERLLVLCMYLRDTENCYPLRSLAVASCLDVICVGSIPYFARASILRFILGPADFILYHLETRIQLSGAISILLQQDPCEDIEFRALLLRIAKKIGVAKPKSLLEQRKASQQENIIAVSVYDSFPVE
ncbi:hypothetical protein BGX21_006388 [Mortierella sp. AD011]|nr:hypothetical protein BGX20_000003 [Mortierella sp. AD010]KAF9403205.1 hypothetical protein BGX21_006388 [Mortierella sp. AD011]